MKPTTLDQLARKFVAKFGSVPGSREADYLIYAFIKGYRAAQRRGKK